MKLPLLTRGKRNEIRVRYQWIANKRYANERKYNGYDNISRIYYISGKVGGLTDLTGAAAANGLLVGITGEHAEASKNINGLYGSHISNIVSSFNAIDPGK